MRRRESPAQEARGACHAPRTWWSTASQSKSSTATPACSTGGCCLGPLSIPCLLYPWVLPCVRPYLPWLSCDSLVLASASVCMQAPTMLSLQHLQQLCGALRPPLPMGGPVHRQSEWTVYLQ